MIRRQQQGRDQVKVTFALPIERAKKVSVVGDFNSWTPGRHTLLKRSNGTCSVAVTLPRGRVHHFRYLGEGGEWFDDPQADEYAPQGGVLHT